MITEEQMSSFGGSEFGMDYTERENLITMRKLDACNFFLLCNDSWNDWKQTQLMPASVHATVSDGQHSAWVTHVILQARVGICEISKYFTRKQLRWTPIFIALIFSRSHNRNAREKMKKFDRKKFLVNKTVLFSTFTKNLLRRIFLKSLCIFLF